MFINLSNHPVAKRIYDFYRYPPKVGQTIVYCPVDDDDWAWFSLDEGEVVPSDADPEMTTVYDGHHARDLGVV